MIFQPGHAAIWVLNSLLSQSDAQLGRPGSRPGNVAGRVGARAELSPCRSWELAELSALPGMTWPRVACAIPSA